ncbi:MAG: hypothetical protein M0R22_02640 [Dehalococcoidia bacterium]|jgi:hypothetical protein|nr:hypothetical protein [Dehalococcoidia bacterium]
MDDEKGESESFEGYHIPEDSDVEKALDEYKAADEDLWKLTRKYLYPPEEVPYVGQRQLVFPTVAAREDYHQVRRKAAEAQERYERIAHERQQQGSGSTGA